MRVRPRKKLSAHRVNVDRCCIPLCILKAKIHGMCITTTASVALKPLPNWRCALRMVWHRLTPVTKSQVGRTRVQGLREHDRRVRWGVLYSASVYHLRTGVRPERVQQRFNFPVARPAGGLGQCRGGVHSVPAFEKSGETRRHRGRRGEAVLEGGRLRLGSHDRRQWRLVLRPLIPH